MASMGYEGADCSDYICFPIFFPGWKTKSKNIIQTTDLIMWEKLRKNCSDINDGERMTLHRITR